MILTIKDQHVAATCVQIWDAIQIDYSKISWYPVLTGEMHTTFIARGKHAHKISTYFRNIVLPFEKQDHRFFVKLPQGVKRSMYDRRDNALKLAASR